MDNLKKQNITNALRTYCKRYVSQNQAANSLKDVSAATISQMLNAKWDLIKDEMWRNVAAQVGYKEDKWAAVETTNFKRMMTILADVQANHLALAITGAAGTGKTFACKQYTASTKQVYHLCCNEYWNRKSFLAELLSALGRDHAGYNVGEMMDEALRTIKMQEAPLLILDEADKLSDKVFCFFITLYNQLEDECGIVLCATDHLEKRIVKGIRLGKTGYNEIWSRLGRRCVELKGVNASDIVGICEANGVSDNRNLDDIIEDCESDLRRVKRRVHAITRKRQLKAD